MASPWETHGKMGSPYKSHEKSMATPPFPWEDHEKPMASPRSHGKAMGIYGNSTVPMETTWEAHGKLMGSLWEHVVSWETHGKIALWEHHGINLLPWESHGKPIEKSRRIYVRPWESHGKHKGGPSKARWFHGSTTVPWESLRTVMRMRTTANT